MKIAHICLANFYIDGYSYQENLLPRYHKKMGYEVEIVASLFTFDKNGKGTFLSECEPYFNEDGIKVSRLSYRKPSKLYRKLRRYNGLQHVIEKASPDLLFIHGCQFLDIDIVVRYLRMNPQVQVFVDNHADFSNSATNWLSKTILHKVLWRRAARMIEPFTVKFYGVLPARVDFLVDIYKVPPYKCKLLVMGADDDLVEAAQKPAVRASIRKKHGIEQGDFLIVTGGKIDAWKTQTFLLMEAVKRINNPKAKLIVFGSVTQELKAKMQSLSDGVRIQYIGWISADDSYKYFAAADLVVFPGRHSVFWEQVVAQGIPMVCKFWEGTTHVDFGDNVKYLYNDDESEIKRILEEIISNGDLYKHMHHKANSENRKAFLYSEIAKQSIGLNKL